MEKKSHTIAILLYKIQFRHKNTVYQTTYKITQKCSSSLGCVQKVKVYRENECKKTLYKHTGRRKYKAAHGTILYKCYNGWNERMFI